MLTRCWRSKKSLACQMTWQKHGSQVCTWAWGGTQCMDILKIFRRRMHASRSCGRVSSRRVCPSSWSSSQRNCKQPGHSCVVTSQPLLIFRFWPNWGTSPRVWQIMCLQIVWLPILRSSSIWTRCTKSHRSKPGTKCEPRATERGPKVQAEILRLDFLQDPRVTDWLQKRLFKLPVILKQVGWCQTFPLPKRAMEMPRFQFQDKTWWFGLPDWGTKTNGKERNLSEKASDLPISGLMMSTNVYTIYKSFDLGKHRKMRMSLMKAR